MRNAIFIGLFIAAVQSAAQPPVRISADDFLQSVSTHPDLRRRLAEVNSLTARSLAKKDDKLSAEASSQQALFQKYAYAGKASALLSFQRAWMREQQVAGQKHFQEDVLAVKANGNDVLLKQEVLTRSSQLYVFELESERKQHAREINEWVRHEYGDQPILPDGWAWSFEEVSGTTSDTEDLVTEIRNLSEVFIQINGIIALQEKLIAKIDRKESLTVLHELAELNAYKKKRWDTFEQMAVKKAELYTIVGDQKAATVSHTSGSN